MTLTSMPPPPSRPPLPDRWNTRDFPVLLEIARGLDSGALPDQEKITADLDITVDELNTAWQALREGGYLRLVEGRPRRLSDKETTRLVLTERGYRAVGLWPSEKSADTLVDLLRRAEELTDDPEEKTLIRRAAGAVGSVSRDVITDVVAAIARQQMGV